MVNQRLSQTDILSNKETITFFGYIGAKVRIARSVKNKGIGYAIALDIKDLDKEQVKRFVEEKEEYKSLHITEMHSYVLHKDIGVRVSSSFTWDKYTLIRNVQQLARLGKDLTA